MLETKTDEYVNSGTNALLREK